MGILKNLLVTGSARFVNVIKGTVQKSQNGAYYGTCTTAAATAEKVVTLKDSDGFGLVEGVIIGVKFSYTNTADNAKLNVNKSGAKSIWYNSSVYTGHDGSITGYANRIYYYMYDGTNWVFVNNSSNCVNNSNTYTSAYCETAAATAAKAATMTYYTLTANRYLHFNIRYANTAASALTMNVNSQGAKPIYINGTASSSSNHTLPAGSYIAFYDGTNWYFRTDGKLPAKIDGDAATVNGHSVAKDVPSNAVFTDTTYTAATTAPGNVASTSAVGTSTNYARQDHTHGITLATGDANGQVKIAGTNVSVKGWNTAATHDVETAVANDSKLPTGAAIVSYVDSAPKEIKVNCGTFSALPITVEDSRITSDMGFSGYFELSNDTVKTDVWTVDTYDGYLTINGTITGETSMVLRLVRVATS